MHPPPRTAPLLDDAQAAVLSPVARLLTQNPFEPSGGAKVRAERLSAIHVRNLCAVPRDLIGSALFGHKRGSFTGAAADAVGCLSLPGPHGSLLLDELGELAEAEQVKLLRPRQGREVMAIGETLPRKIEGRLLFATHRDLVVMSREGAFRADLLERIGGSIRGGSCGGWGGEVGFVDKRSCSARSRGRGDCWDNAVAESFFATIQGEMIDHEIYLTRRAAIAAIEDYIEKFYNPCGRHPAIGYDSPIELEMKFMSEQIEKMAAQGCCPRDRGRINRRSRSRCHRSAVITLFLGRAGWRPSRRMWSRRRVATSRGSTRSASRETCTRPCAS